MRTLAALILAWALAAGVRADEIQVAVASNFLGPMQRVAAAFERETGHRVRLSAGASGRLYAQIVNGAPYELLLSADAEIPVRLQAQGLAVAGTSFTYAIGRLALWAARPGLVHARGDVLRGAGFRHLALANPRTAPYGAAALQVLQGLGVAEALRGRIVQGENVAQVQQFVASGNAELGFVALAQIWKDGAVATAGSAWIVPESLHAPIRQDAVLLERGRARPAARALHAYLRGDAARAIIRGQGYGLAPVQP
jgi:molybdate transport system substrate-binding protein